MTKWIREIAVFGEVTNIAHYETGFFRAFWDDKEFVLTYPFKLDTLRFTAQDAKDLRDLLDEFLGKTGL